MTVTISITEDAVITAVRAFIISILDPAVQVVQGQVNDVPEPTSQDFITMTPLMRKRLSTNKDSWDTGNPDPNAVASERGTLLTIQLDIHGPNSADNAQIITTLWRDEFACSAIDAAVFQPLYASDGHQMPFINGEKRFENRWTLDLMLQSNPIVETPMQFADSLVAGLIVADLLPST